jgi:hypothetical protein
MFDLLDALEALLSGLNQNFDYDSKPQKEEEHLRDTSLKLGSVIPLKSPPISIFNIGGLIILSQRKLI